MDFTRVYKIEKLLNIMANYGELVDKVIRGSNIILLVLDARRVKESINKDILEKLKGKKFIYVINKIDLISKREQDKIKLTNSVFVSAKKHTGTMNLLKKIMKLGKGKEVTVGVVGFPNTGKSAIINALKGRHSASTSPRAGYTTGLQKIRVSKKVVLIDTPGVFSYAIEKMKKIDKLIIGSVDADKIKDTENAAISLIEELDGKIEKYFDVKKKEDAYDTLEEIAIKQNILKRGGVADTGRMGKEIIRMWQKGKII